MATRRTGDDGVTLIVVLCFIVLVSVLGMSLLGLTTASFQSSGDIKVARQSAYAADGAMELAVSQLVNDKTGDLGTSDGPTCSYTLKTLNGYDTTVTCAPFDASSGQWNASNSRNALLTLSTAADSLTLSQNYSLYVDGPVYSNGGISVGQSQQFLDSTWTVRTDATGTDCPSTSGGASTAGLTSVGKVTASRGVYCGTGSHTTQGDDPAWTLPTTSGLTSIDPLTSTLITCTPYNGNGNGKGKNGGGILTLPPGAYSTSPIAWLTANANSKCADDGSTIYFKPGVYKFTGFTFQPDNGNASYDVVAGTAASWLTNKSAPPTDGTACSSTSSGTQLVLGAGASINVANNDQALTWCAGPSGAKPALAVSAASTVTGTVITTANKPNVFVNGVIYLPGATADLTMHNKSQTSFAGGIVVNKLVAEVSASTKQSEPAISLPACTSAAPCRSDRKVVFRAVVNGTQRLTSVMSFDDGYGLKPGTSTALQSWSLER